MHHLLSRIQAADSPSAYEMLVVTNMPLEREHGDGEQPLVPCHDEPDELVEAELRPLIQTAFKRHHGD